MQVRIGIALAVFAIPLAWSSDICRVWHETGAFDACQGQFESPATGMRNLQAAGPKVDSHIRLVKFDGPILPSQRAALIGLDVEILDYLPRYAYVVRMHPGLDRQVRRIDGVVTAGPLPAMLKIGRSVVESMRSGEFDARAMPLVVSLWPGGSLDERGEQVRSLSGLELAFAQRGPRGSRLVVAVEPRFQQQVMAELAGMEAVSAISVHREPVYLNSQGGWLHQSGENASTTIFDQGIYGCGQTIGVLDSGVDFGHCSFVDPDQATPPISECDEGSDCPAGVPDPDQRTTSLYYKWSFNDSNTGDASCASGEGHGTHVAASAVGNNLANPADCDALSTPGNQTNLDGSAPGAKLIAQEMGEQLEYLNDLSGTLYHAGSTAHENGARIHNNSWGVACYSNGSCIPGCTGYGSLARDADFLAWDYPDLAVFFAAGNDGASSCAEQVGAPGNAKNIFSIGSNNRGTGGESVSGFSSRGPIVDGRTKPDLMAQGASIRSAASSGDPNTQTCTTCTISGTSMASPTAAGTAALVREYLERGFYPSGVETPADAIDNPASALVKAIMVNSARFMTGTGGGDSPNQNQGWGRITLDDALYFDGDERRLFLAEPVQPLETGDELEYLFQVEAGQPFKATLAWTDYPAMLGAGIHLVNQLRLEVQTPSGQTWTQKLTPGDPDPFQATTDSDHDDLNNVQQILFDAPDAGEYRLRVRAIHVPMGGGQSFALAVTGDLEGSLLPSFTLGVDPEQVEVCSEDDALYQVSLLSVADFNDPVTLSISQGLPPAADATFSLNPVTPADPAANSLLTVDTASAATGIHVLTLSAESTPGAHEPVARSRDLQLQIVSPVISTTSAVAPPDGALGAALAPMLEWSSVDQATGYRIQIATDAGFVDVVVDETVTDTVFMVPSLQDNTTYFWRVAAGNACGQGGFSDPFSFTTVSQFCSVPDKVLPAGGVVSDLINIDAPGYIGQVSVVLEVSFNWPGDLVADLEHVETGTTVDLFNRPGVPDGSFGQGCETADLDLVLVDDFPSVQDIANCSPSPPGLRGMLAPAQPLSAMIGPAIGGDWIVTIEDSQGLEGDGQLHRWCVQLIVDPVSRMLFRDRFEAPD